MSLSSGMATPPHRIVRTLVDQIGVPHRTGETSRHTLIETRLADRMPA